MKSDLFKSVLAYAMIVLVTLVSWGCSTTNGGGGY